jgi:hypothetical protein
VVFLLDLKFGQLKKLCLAHFSEDSKFLQLWLLDQNVFKLFKDFRSADQVAI